jgi:phosphate transport system permease protein
MKVGTSNTRVWDLPFSPQGSARVSGVFVLVVLDSLILSVHRRTAGFSAIWTGISDLDNVGSGASCLFGAVVSVYGTLVTSVLALVFAVPVSFGIAFYLTELAPMWLRWPVGTAVELLAAVPTIIYGMWGFFVIVPLISQWVQPGLIDALRDLPVIGEPVQGPRSAPASLPPHGFSP